MTVSESVQRTDQSKQSEPLARRLSRLGLSQNVKVGPRLPTLAPREVKS